MYNLHCFDESASATRPCKLDIVVVVVVLKRMVGWPSDKDMSTPCSTPVGRVLCRKCYLVEWETLHWYGVVAHWRVIVVVLVERIQRLAVLWGRLDVTVL